MVFRWTKDRGGIGKIGIGGIFILSGLIISSTLAEDNAKGKPF